MIAGNPNTGTYTSGTYTVPFPPNPDLVEFGKAFDMVLGAIDDPFLVQHAYDTTLKDYFNEKSKSFPTWSGLPEIKVNGPDPLKKSYQIGWYVQVPRPHVVDLDQKDEETLWDS